MERLVRTVVLACGLCILPLSGMLAQQSLDRFTIGPSVGVEENPPIGVNAEYSIGAHFGIGALIHYQQYTIPFGYVEAQNQKVEWYVSAVYHLDRIASLDPYIALRAGSRILYSSIKPTALGIAAGLQEEEPGTFRKTNVHAAIGTRYEVTPVFSLHGFMDVHLVGDGQSRDLDVMIGWDFIL